MARKKVSYSDVTQGYGKAEADYHMISYDASQPAFMPKGYMNKEWPDNDMGASMDTLEYNVRGVTKQRDKDRSKFKSEQTRDRF